MILRYILVISLSLAGLFIHIAAILTLLRIRKTENSALYLIFISWFLWGFNWYFIGAGHYYLDVMYAQIGFVIQIISTYFLLYFLEYNSQSQVRPSRIMILTVISSLYLYFIFQPDNHEIIHDYGIHFVGNIRILQILLALFYNYITFEWIVKIYRNSPESLKKGGAKKLLYAGILMDILPVFIYILASYIVPLGATPFLVYAIGVLMVVFIVRNNPKLLYILTFRAHRMIVFGQKSGLLYYEYQWTPKEFGHKLLASLMHSVSTLSEKVLESGVLDEMELQEGTVLFYDAKEYTIAVFANRPSKYLQTSIKGFAHDFEILLKKSAHDESRGVSSENFKFTEKLIKKHFTNIPRWIQPNQ